MKSTSKILKLREVDHRVYPIIPCGFALPSGNGVLATAMANVDIVKPEEVLACARDEAEAIVEAARDEARRIVSEAEAASELARCEGYQVGYEAGVAAAEEEMRQHVQAIAAVASNVTVDKGELIKECEAEIVSLVIAVAQKVIAKEVNLDRSIVVKTVDRALKRVAGQAVLRVRVNPDDYDLVREYWVERNGIADVAAATEVIADKRIKTGGCVIDTQGGTVDAQVETQLTEMKRAFDVVTELK